MRLFVAAPLPDAVRAALDAALGPLRGRRSVRWSRPATWHVTLAFIGSVDEADAPRVEAALADALPPPAFEAALGAWGGFPDLRAPRVVWVGVEPAGPFEALARAVRDALAARDAPFDRKPFRPHVTVGRASSRGGRVRLPAAWAPPPGGAWRVASFVLFESDLRPAGVLHTPRRAYPLPD